MMCNWSITNTHNEKKSIVNITVIVNIWMITITITLNNSWLRLQSWLHSQKIHDYDYNRDYIGFGSNDYDYNHDYNVIVIDYMITITIMPKSDIY